MYAVRPFNFHCVCVKEIVGKFEISIAFDDSCGAMKDLQRGDIKVFSAITGEDVSSRVYSDTIMATIDNLEMVHKWCLIHSGQISLEQESQLATIRILGINKLLPKEEAMHELWSLGIRGNYFRYVLTGITQNDYFEYVCKQDALEWADMEKGYEF